MRKPSAASSWEMRALAAATDQPETGYVLTAKEVKPDAEAGIRATERVSTQQCD